MVCCLYSKLVVGFGAGADNVYYPPQQALSLSNISKYIQYTIPHNSLFIKNKVYKVILRKDILNKELKISSSQSNQLIDINFIDIDLQITLTDNKSDNQNKIELQDIIACLQKGLKKNAASLKKYTFNITTSASNIHIDAIQDQGKTTQQDTMFQLNLFNKSHNLLYKQDNNDKDFYTIDKDELINLIHFKILKDKSKANNIKFPDYYIDPLPDHSYQLHSCAFDVFIGIDTEGSSMRMGNFYVPATKICLYSMVSFGLAGFARELKDKSIHYYQPEPISCYFGIHTSYIGVAYVVYSSILYNNYSDKNNILEKLVNMFKSSGIGISLHIGIFLIYIIYDLDGKIFKLAIHLIYFMNNVKYTQKAKQLTRRTIAMVVQ